MLILSFAVKVPNRFVIPRSSNRITVYRTHDKDPGRNDPGLCHSSCRETAQRLGRWVLVRVDRDLARDDAGLSGGDLRLQRGRNGDAAVLELCTLVLQRAHVDATLEGALRGRENRVAYRGLDALGDGAHEPRAVSRVRDTAVALDPHDAVTSTGLLRRSD